MTQSLAPVTAKDAGLIEGAADFAHPALKLYFAIKAAAPENADRLYDKVSDKYELKFVNAQQWATNMNAAIQAWNQVVPQNESQVIAAFGI